MYVIVVGCGRVGAELAMLLSRRQHDVTVIENGNIEAAIAQAMELVLERAEQFEPVS